MLPVAVLAAVLGVPQCADQRCMSISEKRPLIFPTLEERFHFVNTPVRSHDLIDGPTVAICLHPVSFMTTNEMWLVALLCALTSVIGGVVIATVWILRQLPMVEKASVIQSVFGQC